MLLENHDAIPNRETHRQLQVAQAPGVKDSSSKRFQIHSNHPPQLAFLNSRAKHINPLFMRFPSIPTIVRAFHTFANTTVRATNPALRIHSIPQRATTLRSMPNIPFLGALFGSSSSNMADKTSYPVQKTEGEWQAQLSPGTFARMCRLPSPIEDNANIPGFQQSNSAYSAKKALKWPARANTTNTTPPRESTPAPPATRLSTKRITNSTQAVGGPHSGTLCLVPWASGMIPASA